MTAASQIALMAALDLPAVTGDAPVPEWVHLLPTTEGSIETQDRRGPYHVADADTLIARSFAETDRLPIDENHATDLAALAGGPSPARGWIVEMQARADGIWGRVEWTRAGREMVADRAYRALSPVMLHDKAKNVLRVLRASLVNRPNLRGLAALNHQEDDEMSLSERLAELLGCEDTEDAIVDAVTSLHAAQEEADDGATVALQSSLAAIGTALGLPEAASPATIVAAAQVAAEGSEDAGTIAALQSELADLGTQLNTMREGNQRAAAESVVDRAIAEGRVGVKPMRERYIALHMADAAATEAQIAALPAVAGRIADLASPPEGGEIKSLNSAQREAARLIGVSEEAYLKTLQAERKQEEAV